MSTDLEGKNSMITEEENNNDQYSYQPRSRVRSANKPKNEKVKKTQNKFNKFFVIIPCAIIILIFAAIMVYSMSMPKDVIAPNISIAGVDVGGMDVDKAKTKIDGMIDDKEFGIVSSGNRLTINSADINLSVDYDATVKKAIKICKSDNIFKNALNATILVFKEIKVPLEMTYNVEQLDKVLFDFGTTFNGLSTEQQYEYSDNSLTVIPATAGQNPDVSVARGEFLNAVGNGIISDIEVMLDYATPKMLNLEEVYAEICGPAQNASYALDENGEIKVNEHHIGVEVKKEDLQGVLESVNMGNKASCPATITLPEKTKEDLEAKLFNGTLGKHTTDFSTSSANRAYNVSLAAESINNKILMPGEEFSYNNTIGNPNAERGYKIAGIFSNGKTAEGVGGGICQVSSTLYSAVLYADLEVVERHNHSLTVSYVPKGQDATVSYGVIDFRFKNNTEYPIKIESVTSNRKLSISIIGTKYEPEKKVKISHSLVSTITPTDNETIDETLPAGTRNVVTKGSTGYIIDTYKTVYENGVEVKSDKITRSSYRMVPNEVTVGPKIEEQPTIDAPVEEETVTEEPIVDTVVDETVDVPVIAPIEPNRGERPTPN